MFDIDIYATKHYHYFPTAWDYNTGTLSEENIPWKLTLKNVKWLSLNSSYFLDLEKSFNDSWYRWSLNFDIHSYLLP